MKTESADLRILRLAQLYEEAYETFVRHVARELVSDPDVRRRLGRIAPPGDSHAERIRALIAKERARLGPLDAPEIERSAIQDVVDVERAAREFYLRHADDLHDREAAALFRDLAREETGRVRIAEEALDRHDARMREAGLDPRPPRAEEPDVPLHEGVSDLERARYRREA